MAAGVGRKEERKKVWMGYSVFSDLVVTSIEHE